VYTTPLNFKTVSKAFFIDSMFSLNFKSELPVTVVADKAPVEGL
jgi:hypothetical protein